MVDQLGPTKSYARAYIVTDTEIGIHTVKHLWYIRGVRDHCCSSSILFGETSQIVSTIGTKANEETQKTIKINSYFQWVWFHEFAWIVCEEW